MWSPAQARYIYKRARNIMVIIYAYYPVSVCTSKLEIQWLSNLSIKQQISTLKSTWLFLYKQFTNSINVNVCMVMCVYECQST